MKTLTRIKLRNRGYPMNAGGMTYPRPKGRGSKNVPPVGQAAPYIVVLPGSKRRRPILFLPPT